ncbi:retinoic acid receptor responder protein 1 [Trichechus manatus latirostris]|uniref:Retinoic acid receptor responder protein 1 n=1 Tax=Trichechus manatus latirostris TaxID=127582 RepID=A0A2Y9R507_TRIMA|nr:retinoic acid receptor responder protein 1 [Trichechus manatus latirostris]
MKQQVNGKKANQLRIAVQKDGESLDSSENQSHQTISRTPKGHLIPSLARVWKDASTPAASSPSGRIHASPRWNPASTPSLSICSRRRIVTDLFVSKSSGASRSLSYSALLTTRPSWTPLLPGPRLLTPASVVSLQRPGPPTVTPIRARGVPPPPPPEGRARINPNKGCRVDVAFTTELYNPKEGAERLGRCSAQVFFRNQKSRPSVNVTCTRLIEKKKRQEEDYLLYQQMNQLKTPLGDISIPDCHGYIDPSLRPIWDLAVLGSSYVMWEKTSQFLYYYVVQLSSMVQWKTDNEAIDFDYTVLLHEFPTQEIIPCRIHLVWYPGKPPKVKYRCQELQTPEEASETEGSAAAPTDFSIV